MKKLLLTVLSLLVVGVSTLFAGPTPEVPPKGVKIISIADAMTKAASAQVFDVRKALNFGKGHATNATSLPVRWVNKKLPHAERDLKFKTKKMPTDMDATIIVYSDGIAGWKSYHFSRILAEKGFKNVNWMRQGYNGWKAAKQNVVKYIRIVIK